MPASPMSWCRSPPCSTLSSCAPRQTPTTGMSSRSAVRRAARSRRSRCRSVGPSRSLRGLPVQARVDVVHAAREDQPVGAGHVEADRLAVDDADARAGPLEPGDVARRLLVAHEQQDRRARIVGAQPGERDGERVPRAGDALARRILGDVEHVAELAQRQTRLVAQEQDQALVRGQRRQRLARIVLDVVARRRHVGEGDLVAPAPAAQLVEREVGRGAVQPGAQGRRRHVAGRRAPGACQRLLAEVLRGLRVAHHARRPPRERADLLGEDGLEGDGRHRTRRDVRARQDRTAPVSGRRAPAIDRASCARGTRRPAAAAANRIDTQMNAARQTCTHTISARELRVVLDEPDRALRRDEAAQERHRAQRASVPAPPHEDPDEDRGEAEDRRHSPVLVHDPAQRVRAAPLEAVDHVAGPGAARVGARRRRRGAEEDGRRAERDERPDRPDRDPVGRPRAAAGFVARAPQQRDGCGRGAASRGCSGP